MAAWAKNARLASLPLQVGGPLDGSGVASPVDGDASGVALGGGSDEAASVAAGVTPGAADPLGPDDPVAVEAGARVWVLIGGVAASPQPTTTRATTRSAIRGSGRGTRRTVCARITPGA